MKVVVEKSGVVGIEAGYNSGIMVNGQSLISLLSEEVDKVSPNTDFYGQFAARVKIEVEFNCDVGTGDDSNECSVIKR